MRKSMSYLGGACTGALLLACASPGPGILAPQAGDGQASSRNGQAVLAASQGDYRAAIGLWRESAAALTETAGADSAFLFRNLGRAHLLAGDIALARAALEKACLLDPLNPLGWEYLGQALARAGQPGRAALMARQALSLRRHDTRADYALLRAQPGGPAPAPVPAPSPSLAAVSWPVAMPRSEVTVAGAGLLELRRVPGGAGSDVAAPPPTGGVPPAVSQQPGSAPLRLEIRNGNGVSGMAAALARLVGGAGLRVVRLSNQRHFLLARSRVEYGPAREDEARALAARLGALTVRADTSCGVADLRLVLGRDLSDPVALRRHYLKPAGPAALETVARLSGIKRPAAPAPTIELPPATPDDGLTYGPALAAHQSNHRE